MLESIPGWVVSFLDFVCSKQLLKQAKEEIQTLLRPEKFTQPNYHIHNSLITPQNRFHYIAHPEVKYECRIKD